MRFSRYVWIFLLACGLGFSCASNRPDKFEAKIREWIPLGTPERKAEEIMKKHGYECRLVSADSRFNPTGKSYLDCERENAFLHNWNVRFFVVDDKIAEYGDFTVD